MAYVRKTMDVYELITDYGYGKEVECTYTDKHEAYVDFFIYKQEQRAGYLPDLRYITVRTRRVRKENI